jgi:hypothetical protein
MSNITVIDEHTFPALYTRYSRKVRSKIARLGIPADDRDDVCADAWLTAWRYRHRYDPKYSVVTYLMLQARGAASWYRRRRSRQIECLGYAVPVAEDHFASDDSLPRIYQPGVPTAANGGWPWRIAPIKLGKEAVPPQRPLVRPQRRTRCRNGHDLSDEANVFVYPPTDGYQRCRICANNAKARKLTQLRDATQERQRRRAAQKARSLVVRYRSRALPLATENKSEFRQHCLDETSY